MKRYSYLFAYILFMAIPSVALLFLTYHSINIEALVIVVLASFFIGGVFDIWATRQGKKDKFYLWEYNTKTTFNRRFMGMEVEDISLFLLLTPVFTIAAWEGAKVLVAHYSIPLLPLIIGGAVAVFVAYHFTVKIAAPKKAPTRKKRRK